MLIGVITRVKWKSPTQMRSSDGFICPSGTNSMPCRERGIKCIRTLARSGYPVFVIAAVTRATLHTTAPPPHTHISPSVAPIAPFNKPASHNKPTFAWAVRIASTRLPPPCARRLWTPRLASAHAAGVVHVVSHQGSCSPVTTTPKRSVNWATSPPATGSSYSDGVSLDYTNQPSRATQRTLHVEGDAFSGVIEISSL